MNEFCIGDVVKLAGGGIRMTVVAVSDDGVNCAWFEPQMNEKGGFSNRLNRAVWPPGAIRIHVQEDRNR